MHFVCLNMFKAQSILLLIILLQSRPGLAATAEIVDSLLEKQDYQSALQQADAGLTANPTDTKLMLQKGFILIKLRQLPQAEQYYLDMIEKIPDDPEPLNNLGVVYQLMREYGKAINQFNTAIQRFPDFTRAYENLGDTYIQIATVNYLNGRSKSPEDKLLISKADLGQRFYEIARTNINDAVTKHSGANNEQSTASRLDNAGNSSVIEQQVADFLRSWVAAWSSRNPEAYFAHYSDDFEPTEGQSRKNWKERKSRILESADFINIRIEKIEIINNSDQQISIAFTQKYESNTYKNEYRKELTLNQYDGNWLINKEL